MKAWKIFVAVFSSLVGLFAIACLVGGIFLTIANAAFRDADGFFTSPDYDLSTPGYAIVSDRFDIASRTGDWFPSNFLDVRLSVESDEPALVGVGPSADVDEYLGDVARAEADHLGDSRGDVRLIEREGGAPASPPPSRRSGSCPTRKRRLDRVGGGARRVDRGGDERRRVRGSRSRLRGSGAGGSSAGHRHRPHRLRRRHRRSRRPGSGLGNPRKSHRGFRDGSSTGVRRRGVALSPGRGGQARSRAEQGLWLVKWLLAIPHVIVLGFLWAAFVVLTIVAFFAIAFTGHYPRGIFDFNVGVMRWTWRVSFYVFGVAATDQYPPFALREMGDYPATLDVEYPEGLSRGLVWVKSWLLAIPHLIIVGFLTSGLIWWTTDAFGGGGVLQIGGGIVGFLVLIALIVLLFTGRYPQGLFELVMGLNRWAWRVGAYVALMTDEYPPFRLDLGGDEPAATGAQERLPLE